MSKYRKKPVIIDANKWFKVGDHPAVEHETTLFARCDQCGKSSEKHGEIWTLESGAGKHVVCPGDWIITGIKGEVYACKPDIFAQTYEEIE